MNVFLTGERHAGKSMVITKTINGLDLRVGGFCTTFGPQRSEADRLLCMHHPAQGAVIAPEYAVARFSSGIPVAMAYMFDSLGCSLLDKAKCSAQIIVMDELGWLEKDANKFRQAVLSALDSNIPVLGVLREGLPGWTKEIAARHDVKLVTVTLENRDRLPVVLKQWLKSPEICGNEILK